MRTLRHEGLPSAMRTRFCVRGHPSRRGWHARAVRRSTELVNSAGNRPGYQVEGRAARLLVDDRLGAVTVDTFDQRAELTMGGAANEYVAFRHRSLG